MPTDPKRTAFLFPGQGSQAVGMGLSLAQAEPAAAAVFSQTDEILGYPLSKLCWEGPQETLNDTLHTQPALLTHSIAVLKVFERRYPDFQPAFTAGHSLGEYSALVHAGALTFVDAVNLVQARGRAMKAAGEKNPGGMVAVLGLDVDEVGRVCEIVTQSNDAGVWIANDNCPGQVVISGHEGALNLASERLIELGAKKVVRLAVSIASHSPLMEIASRTFNQVLQATDFRDPCIAVVGNVEARPLQTASQVCQDLGAQLTARVRWTESIRTMLDAGVDTFIELGPKNVLTGLLRRIDRNSTGLNLDAPLSFTQLADTI